MTTQRHSTISTKADQNKAGLSLQERRLLSEIAACGSWQQAADTLGMSRRNVRALFRKPEFKDAYDTIFTVEDISITKREIEQVATGVATVLEEAQNAEAQRTVTAVCPSCGAKHPITIDIPHWPARLKAVEMLLKMIGLLQDKKQVSVNGQVNVVSVQLTGAELVALQRLKMGLPIPEHIYHKLEDWARAANEPLPALPVGSNMIGNAEIIEGEIV